jgi:hypothetical protein
VWADAEFLYAGLGPLSCHAATTCNELAARLCDLSCTAVRSRSETHATQSGSRFAFAWPPTRCGMLLDRIRMASCAGIEFSNRSAAAGARSQRRSVEWLVRIICWIDAVCVCLGLVVNRPSARNIIDQVSFEQGDETV